MMIKEQIELQIVYTQSTKRMFMEYVDVWRRRPEEFNDAIMSNPGIVTYYTTLLGNDLIPGEYLIYVDRDKYDNTDQAEHSLIAPFLIRDVLSFGDKLINKDLEVFVIYSDPNIEESFVRSELFKVTENNELSYSIEFRDFEMITTYKEVWFQSIPG